MLDTSQSRTVRAFSIVSEGEGGIAMMRNNEKKEKEENKERDGCHSNQRCRCELTGSGERFRNDDDHAGLSIDARN
jgi:hypothetical protein